jgi:hypothetical protein
MGGRPSKMTDEVCKRILEDIAEGVPKTKAFSTNGIAECTGYRWALENEQFCALLQQAEDLFEANTLKELRAAGRREVGEVDWRATAMLLKMRRPEYRDKGVEVSVTQAVINQKAFTPADLEALREVKRISMK